ncbi:uncharacterized protein LOC128768506 isoform X1 [Synchiropus splendidus]|uniref:uncharacterized protein LOC128768506 isoform X1 n=1 Tax=Synchiropus splendidus TaxID=270530 RepID=UPI00237D432E|nr:uncharacterized protein LOC128768506 isoform X1 [Synchiropus splendidus]
MRILLCFMSALLSSTAQRLVLVKPRETVILKCGVDSITGFLEWRHGQDVIFSVDGKSGLVRAGNAPKAKLKKGIDLELRNVKENNAGLYQCNADGKISKQILQLISVQVSPSELTVGGTAWFNCDVPGRQTLVQWMSPRGSLYNNPMPIVRPLSSSHSGRWLCVFSHDGETYSHGLDVTVKEATTAPSPTTIASYPTNNTSPPPPTHRSGELLFLGLGGWMWAALAFSILMLMLLTLLIYGLSKQLQRRKHRLLRMKKNRVYCNCRLPTAAASLQRGRRRDKP